jgi:hypothetical protein
VLAAVNEFFCRGAVAPRARAHKSFSREAMMVVRLCMWCCGACARRLDDYGVRRFPSTTMKRGM